MTRAASTIPGAQVAREPSTGRLVNLALGASSAVTLAAAMAGFPYLEPSRWLLVTWLSPSSAAALPAASMLLVRLGLDVCLPASALMIVFLLAGLHRRPAFAGRGWHAAALAAGWIVDIAVQCAAAMTPAGQNARVVVFVVGMFLSPVYLAACAAAAAAAVGELSAMTRARAPASGTSPSALLGWSIAPPILCLLPLLAAPSQPLVVSARQRHAFDALCKEAGVQLLDKPSAPVRSVAYDWDPALAHQRHSLLRIQSDAGHRLLGRGGFSSPGSAESRKRLELDFTERRHDPLQEGGARVDPQAPYYHFPDARSAQPYYGVNALTADALAVLKVDDAGTLDGDARPVARYRLTLTDRRSGAILGIQTFLVDDEDHRACGINVDSAISPDAFIYDAIHR